MPTAYSYLRFSSPAQAAGDSTRRQTEARDRWLADHPDVVLDKTLRMTDAGRSAFKRKDWATYALARFVDAIEAGRVAAGSYLLLENLDRLSRESAGEATQLFLSIVNKGIVVVQLAPVVIEFKKPVEMMPLMFAVLELSRGHSESAMKSERSGAAWARKQKEAATKVVTKRLPGWIKIEGGRLVLDEPKAAVVRRIFALAVDGHGALTIAKTLNAEGVKVLGRAEMKGRAVAWAGVTVRHILATRAVLGEYSPYKTDRTRSAGEPVLNYFPAVVDAATYAAAREATAKRAVVGRGRRGKHINLFAGMLTDARDGGAISYKHQKPRSTLVPTNPAKGMKWTTFPAGEFETGVLSQLLEVGAAEVMDLDRDATSLDVLTGEITAARAALAVWEARMDDLSITDIVAKKLGELNTKLKTLNVKLAEAQRKAASPLSTAWGDFKSAAGLLAKDSSDEMRLKVRTALRRAVVGVSCLFVGVDGATRTAAVQVHFAGTDRFRLYTLVSRVGKPLDVRSYSFVHSTVDLREADGREAMEQYLRELPAKLT